MVMTIYVENERITKVPRLDLLRTCVILQKGESYAVENYERRVGLDNQFGGNMVYFVWMHNLDTYERRLFLVVFEFNEGNLFTFRLHRYNVHRARYIYQKNKGIQCTSKEDDLLAEMQDILKIDSRVEAIYDTRKDYIKKGGVPKQIKELMKISFKHRGTRKKLGQMYRIQNLAFPEKHVIQFYPDLILEHTNKNHRGNIRHTYIELELSNHDTFHQRKNFMIKLIRYTSKTNNVIFVCEDNLVDHHMELFLEFLGKNGNKRFPSWYIAPLSDFLDRGLFATELVKDHFYIYERYQSINRMYTYSDE